ncbi:MAG: hypothetical protein K2X87_05965 [Gemmataceae bacterium]|nr:hypothetical protein [Gemmataceae bacterium]
MPTLHATRSAAWRFAFGLVMVGGVGVAAVADDDPPVVDFVKFDGPAGKDQTSPSSPASGKVAATGTYKDDKNPTPSVTVIKCYCREKGTTGWKEMNTTKNATAKTWAADQTGLTGGKTYEVQADMTWPGVKHSTDVREIRVMN